MNFYPVSKTASGSCALSLALALASCSGAGDLAVDAAPYPGPPGQGLDLLFVIDNSGAMLDEQASLVENFGRFVNVLRTLDGGLPEIHIGVVSTDMGAGDFGIGGCTEGGDSGVLQNTARAVCTPPGPERFIRDRIAEDGVSRTGNYTGALEESFACIAELGVGGCNFEQPLESMRRALDGSNPQNSGFLRPEAYLAVVILSDEDDCSVRDVNLFNTDPSLDTNTSSIGFLSSFRCFEFGVACQPDTPRVQGERSDCEARDNSQFMYDVGEYVSFLKSLKNNPNNVMVATIVGPPTPVLVFASGDDDRPTLNSSCVAGDDQASPAVRLAAFADGFPERSVATTICNDDLNAALIQISELLVAVMGRD